MSVYPVRSSEMVSGKSRARTVGSAGLPRARSMCVDHKKRAHTGWESGKVVQWSRNLHSCVSVGPFVFGARSWSNIVAFEAAA